MSNPAADEVSSRATAFTEFRSFTPRSLVGGLTAAAAWLAAAALTAFWPDQPESDWAYTGDLAGIFGAVAVAILAAVVAEYRFVSLRRVRALSPWLVALALFFVAWELIT